MLFIQLIQSMSVVVLGAYIFSQSKVFKAFLLDKSNQFNRALIVVFFVTISILSTYMGIEITSQAIATTRPIGVLAAGYIGGPMMGLLTGAIVGIHRYFYGGFTHLACSIATFLAGVIGAFAHRKYRHNNNYILISVIMAAIAELLHIAIVLMIAAPFSSALLYARTTTLPLLAINSFGLAAFVNVVKKSIEEDRKASAVKSQIALYVAKEALKYTKKGLSRETAKEIAEIIKGSVGEEGVLIGNRHELLCYTGKDIPEGLLEKAFKSYYISPEEKLLELDHADKRLYIICCPIFTDNKEFQGVIGLRVPSLAHADRYTVNFLKELSELLGTQIELHRLNKLAQEVTLAELKALRAQIQPHFLFNALNTIAFFCRTDAGRARELIINLAHYFRRTLEKEENLVTLKEELDLTLSYISIEEARFGDKLRLFVDIPETLYGFKLPLFILQPLVENSIKHGLSCSTEGGIISISAEIEGDGINFMVKDTGVGMEEVELKLATGSTAGIGLQNVNNRLKYLYGKNSALNISSTKNVGTEVRFKIPREVS